MMKKMPDVLMWIFLICFFIIIIIIGIDSVFECLSWFVRAFTNKECSFERFALITLTISGFIYYFIYSAKNKYGWYLILHTRAKRIAKRARSLVPDGSDLAFYLSFGEYLRLGSKSISEINCQSDKDILLTILNITYDNLLLSGFEGTDTLGYLFRNSFYDMFDSSCEKLKELGIVVNRDAAYEEIKKSRNFAKQIAEEPSVEEQKRPAGKEKFFVPKKRINLWYCFRIGCIIGVIICITIAVLSILQPILFEYRLKNSVLDRQTVSDSSSIFVGSINSDFVHWNTCRYAQNVNEENRVYYDSISDALTDGRKKCSECLPTSKGG